MLLNLIDVLLLLFVINFINYILFTDLKSNQAHKVNFKLDFFDRLNITRCYSFKNTNFNLFNNKTLVTKWDFEFMLEHFIDDLEDEYFKLPNYPLKYSLIIFESKPDGTMNKLFKEIILEFTINDNVTPENLYNLINNNEICRIPNSSDVFILINKILSPYALATARGHPTTTIEC
jgi:hypothetical protein